MQSLYDAKPFTNYWYYANASEDTCSCCHVEASHYLMRYRIYLGMRFPIIPTSTIYYLVCPNCGHRTRIDSEGEREIYLSKVKNQQPKKYNKYSQLDLEGYEDDEPLTFGTDKELSKNIEIHLNDMNNRRDRHRI